MKTAFGAFVGSVAKAAAVLAVVGLALVLFMTFSSSTTTLHILHWQCHFWNHGWPPHLHCQRP